MFDPRRIRSPEKSYRENLARVRAAELLATSDFSRLRELVDELESADFEAEVSSIEAALRRSFLMYADPRYLFSEAKSGEEPVVVRAISVIVFDWVGAEVPPWVTSMVWGGGFVDADYVETATRNEFDPSAAMNFETCGGFDVPGPLAELAHFAEEEATEVVLDSALFHDVHELMVFYSIWAAQSALKGAAQSDEFAALPTKMPFRFYARPGHDEDVCHLFTVHA